MKRLFLIGILLLGPSADVALAGQCFTPAPFCGYPSIPMCVCSGYQCYWICAHR
jgi:hypothetical protein